MSTTTENVSRYTRREAIGPIEAIVADGIKLDGLWWNNSRRQPLDLSPFRVGDVVSIAASETSDGKRRFLLEIAPAGPRRAASEPAFVHDLPDWPDDALPDDGELPAGPAHRQPERARVGPDVRTDRLACLQIAAGIVGPWWTKTGIDPDPAILLGIADQLVAWLHRDTT